MLWPLIRASLIAPLRRLKALLRQNPALAVLGGLLVVAGPYLLWYAATRTAESFESQLTDDDVASSFAAVFIVMAVLVGVTCSSTLPRLDAVDEQLHVVPVSARSLAVAHALGPVVAASLVLAVPIVVYLGPIMAVAPGGVAATPLVIAAMIIAAALGGVAVEAARVRQVRAWIEAGAFTGTVWLLAGLIGGEAELGLVAIAAHSIVEGPAVLHAVLLAGAAAAAVLYWVKLVAVPSPVHRRTAVRGFRPIRRAGFVHCAVTSRVLRRRPAMRGHLLSVVVLAFAATGFAAATTDVDPSAASALGVVIALLGVLLLPLAAFWIDVEALWLWGSAPGKPAARAMSRIGVALAGALGLFAGLAVALFAATGTDIAELGNVILLVLLLSGPVVVTGVLMPLDTTSVLAQILTYATAAIAGASWLAATMALIGQSDSVAALSETAVAFAMIVVGMAVGLGTATWQMSRVEQR